MDDFWVSDLCNCHHQDTESYKKEDKFILRYMAFEISWKHLLEDTQPTGILAHLKFRKEKWAGDTALAVIRQ